MEDEEFTDDGDNRGLGTVLTVFMIACCLFAGAWFLFTVLPIIIGY